MESINYGLVRQKLEEEIRAVTIPWLKRFINIPNQSRSFDSEWNTNGLLLEACELCLEYARMQEVAGLEVAVYQDEGKTPIVFGTIAGSPGAERKSIMVYGHLDKQPPMAEKWREGLHPSRAVEEHGLLYGRGSLDDGYNFFTLVSLVKVLQRLGVPHDRFVLFYECDEESESRDVPHYLHKFAAVIGSPHAMFCLDTHSISTRYFSLAVSLRGILSFHLTVRVLEKGMHSGIGSGVIPSSFRICRQLLDRIECSKTGEMLKELQVEVPADKRLLLAKASAILKDSFLGYFPLAEGVQPVTADVLEAYTRRAWTPQMEVIGQEGIPLSHECGNVLRDHTRLTCSVRLPPTVAPAAAFQLIKAALERDPPYQAQVEVTWADGGEGWNSNPIPAALLEALGRHTQAVFETEPCFVSNGSSIPFVQVIQRHLPDTLLFVSGAGLPDSSIHGPNEHLNIDYLIKFAQTLTCFLCDYKDL